MVGGGCMMTCVVLLFCSKIMSADDPVLDDHGHSVYRTLEQCQITCNKDCHKDISQKVNFPTSHNTTESINGFICPSLRDYEWVLIVIALILVLICLPGAIAFFCFSGYCRMESRASQDGISTERWFKEEFPKTGSTVCSKTPKPTSPGMQAGIDWSQSADKNSDKTSSSHSTKTKDSSKTVTEILSVTPEDADMHKEQQNNKQHTEQQINKQPTEQQTSTKDIYGKPKFFTLVE